LFVAVVPFLVGDDVFHRGQMAVVLGIVDNSVELRDTKTGNVFNCDLTQMQLLAALHRKWT
jgi:hypothetical protein